jgi:diguanylate cyclase (GGDEF)-like protein
MAAHQNLADMFAALSATNEAILRSSSETEIHQSVCNAAVDRGKFLGTAIFLFDPATSWFELAAGAGPFVHLIEKFRFSADASKPHGQGLGSEAFRTGQPCLSADAVGDPRTQAWKELVISGGVKACAVFPLFRNRDPAGVMHFFMDESMAQIDEESTRLMGLITENVSSGMTMLQREEVKDHLTRLFAALSATNEAIMRAKTRSELFNRVCEAAVLGGSFTTTTVALARPGLEFLEVVASAGPERERALSAKISVDASHPAGAGLSGQAFRSGRACISNDYLHDVRTSHFYELIKASGSRSGAALPLIRAGEVVGIMLFFSTELGAFTPKLVELLERMAENVSFGMENFDRADEKIQADERIKYLATHDGLTGLPNRAMFIELLNASIRLTRRHRKNLAILFIDLDRFKIINDTLGHADGDELLQEVAGRLQQCLRESDIVSRLGGDEFVVILPEVDSEQEVGVVAQKLLSVIMKPVMLSGQECRVTGSIGIALCPDNGNDADTLTKNADMAMYLAKNEGKNAFRFFSSKMKSQSIERLMLETKLRKGLERDEFVLQYQPKIDLRTGQITGVEALIRWEQPDLGMLPPGQFIPLAEETGLIVPIGRWVLKTACEQHMAWKRAGLPAVCMAVNLSPRQFQHENLLQDIDETIKATGIEPEYLELEITEGMVMQNVDRAIGLLTEIKKRGVRLAMDDFGTGYSSMALIKRFPIDTLKIDRSFIRDLPENTDDKAIADAIINLGRALKLTIVAEGVETKDQEAFLRDHACDEMQGYLFSRPVSAASIPALLSLPAVVSPDLQPDHSKTGNFISVPK